MKKILIALILLSFIPVQEDENKEIEQAIIKVKEGKLAPSALSKYGESAVPPIGKLVTDPSIDVQIRWKCAQTLGESESESAVSHLLNGIKSDDFNVRICSAISLGKIGTNEVVEALKKVAEEDQFYVIDPVSAEKKFLVREAAKGALKKIRKRAVGVSFEWVKTLDKAIERAKEENRIILILVIPVEDPENVLGYDDAPSKIKKTVEELGRDPGMIKERVMLASIFSDPSIDSLISKRFVAVSLRVPVWVQAGFYNSTGKSFSDPFKAFGITAKDVQGPAIAFISPEGKLLHAIKRMAVFNVSLVHQVCRRVLNENPKWSSPDSRILNVEKRLKQNHLDSDLWLVHAKLSAASGNFDQAVTSYEKAKEMGKDEEALLGLAQIEFMNSNPDKALENLKLLQVEASDDFPIEGLALKGQILAFQRNFKEAKEVLTSAMEKKSTQDVLFWLAYVLDKLGDKAEARRLWKKIVKEEPFSRWRKLSELYLDDNGPFPDQWITFEFLPQIKKEDPLPTGTEVKYSKKEIKNVVQRAIEYIVRQQNTDGSWLDPSYGTWNGWSSRGSQYDHQIGVTGIATSALMEWVDTLDGDLKKKTLESIKRGIKRIKKFSEAPENYIYHLAYSLFLELRVYKTLEDSEKAEAKERISNLIKGLKKIQGRNGAFSYMNVEIRPHSFDTAIVLMMLHEAKKLKLDVPEEMIEKALKFLDTCRSGKGRKLFHYSTQKEWKTSTTESASSVRSVICETAIHLHTENSTEGVEGAIEAFFKFLDNLRAPTKLYEHFRMPVTVQIAHNYTFGHYYNALALSHCNEKFRKLYVEKQLETILSIVEMDGTWVDSPTVLGKSYATSMILLAIAELRK